MAILVMGSCRRVGAEPMPGTENQISSSSATSASAVDYIFEMADGVYGDIPEGECLVQQMCVDECGEVKCYEFYIFGDRSVAMMPWEEGE